MTRLRLIVLVLALAGLTPRGAEAQWAPAVAGGALGAAGGVLVTFAVITGEARTGRYLYDRSDGYRRLWPVPVMAATAAVIGYRNDDRLWRSVGWGTLGGTVGGVAGALLGEAAWGGNDGLWAGLVLGAAGGLLAGSIIGGATWQESEVSAPVVTFSIPVGR